jgi:hypothetical protein
VACSPQHEPPKERGNGVYDAKCIYRDDAACDISGFPKFRRQRPGAANAGVGDEQVNCLGRIAGDQPGFHRLSVLYVTGKGLHMRASGATILGQYFEPL